MDDFERELKTGFLDEAFQLIADAEQCFLALESSPNDSSILEKIFRVAHNLKGSANAVGFADLGAFTHELESYLLKLKNGALPVHSMAVSLLLLCNDHILKMVTALKENFEAKLDSTELLEQIRDQMAGKSTPAETTVVPFEEATPTLEEVSAMLATETANHISAYEPPVTLPPPATTSNKTTSNTSNGTEESIRVSLVRLEKLLNFVGELVILQTVLREQSSTGSAPLRKTIHQIGKVTKEVQDISMSLRMVPLKQTFQKMQRIVRDTSSALDKKVNLTLKGEDTELDKTVLENLGDPLVHLIRNAVDHGIESTAIRLKNGKSETGQIELNAFHQSGTLVIEIRDDGAGLDPNKLTMKAIEKGILKAGTVLSEKDAYQLIFSSGFSTKAEVTDVSGRGVGMDVVKTNIERLQGEIQIETQLGKGTLFRVKLPLTLAIADGMVIRSGDERFVIPLSHVHESVQPSKTDVHQVTGMGEIFTLRGENLPLYRLCHLLNRKNLLKETNAGIAIVIRTGPHPFSILVDDIIGQHQVVIKQLGEEHRQLKGFAGSAILGDGRPALILELGDLVAKHKPVRSAA